jgi:hypothetical protein
MLAEALRAEVDAYIAQFAAERGGDGRSSTPDVDLTSAQWRTSSYSHSHSHWTAFTAALRESASSPA